MTQLGKQRQRRLGELRSKLLAALRATRKPQQTQPALIYGATLYINRDGNPVGQQRHQEHQGNQGRHYGN